VVPLFCFSVGVQPSCVFVVMLFVCFFGWFFYCRRYISPYNFFFSYVLFFFILFYSSVCRPFFFIFYFLVFFSFVFHFFFCFVIFLFICVFNPSYCLGGCLIFSFWFVCFPCVCV